MAAAMRCRRRRHQAAAQTAAAAALGVLLVIVADTAGAVAAPLTSAVPSMPSHTPTPSPTSWAGAYIAPQVRLPAPVEPTAAWAGYGASLAVSGGGAVAVVGAPNASYGGVADGGVVVAYVAGNSVWVEAQLLVPRDAVPGDAFGAAVAVSGNGAYLVVGAPGRTVGTRAAHGVAMLCVAAGGGRWSHTITLVSALQAGARLGASVAVDSTGTTVALGAPGAASGAGVVVVFTRIESLWSESAILTPTLPSSAAAAAFGAPGSLALASDASLLAVGAPGTSINGSDGVAAVYVFGNPSPPRGSWVVDAVLQPPDGGAAGDGFGTAVALSGTRTAGSALAVGAPARSPNAGLPHAGAAYFYHAAAASAWSAPEVVVGLHGGARLGTAVAVVVAATAGTTLYAGAPGADVAGRPGQGAILRYWRAAGATGPLTALTPLTAPDGTAGTGYGGAIALAPAAVDDVGVFATATASTPGAVSVVYGPVPPPDEPWSLPLFLLIPCLVVAALAATGIVACAVTCCGSYCIIVARHLACCTNKKHTANRPARAPAAPARPAVTVHTKGVEMAAAATAAAARTHAAGAGGAAVVVVSGPAAHTGHHSNGAAANGGGSGAQAALGDTGTHAPPHAPAADHLPPMLLAVETGSATSRVDNPLPTGGSSSSGSGNVGESVP